MALRSPNQYVQSLRDERTVYFGGALVPDVTEHPVIARAIQHASVDFELAEDPAVRPLAVVEAESPFSRYFLEPRSTSDLSDRARLIETATARCHTLVPLIKEIGTDALFALRRISRALDASLGTSERSARVAAFFDHCRLNDLAMSVAQTDVKGDRSLGPSTQPNPDSYLRIVERRSDGIVVRGAKVHTSCTPNTNELIVLPTRAMSAADTDWAVSFAVPVNTPGLKLVASPYGSHAGDEFDSPISSQRLMMETTTLFDNVFVPNERVFLDGQHEFAGPLALAFVDYHRFTAIAYKLPLVDALVGSAALMADMNGISKAAHVRDKLTSLISYAETLRALVESSALRGTPDDAGVYVPDPLIVNIAKSHFAHGYHHALQQVQDLAGGLLVTAPGAADFSNPDTGPMLASLLGGRVGVGGEERIRAMNMVSDLTTREFGGYHAVLAIHAEGSLEAEKMMIARAYDPTRVIAYARQLAGID
ncbi:MAG: 4-hydroxyphenylacetate 3-hydroxylase N-terminal domain-containing protein [Acidimicrobiales bacterium]